MLDFLPFSFSTWAIIIFIVYRDNKIKMIIGKMKMMLINIIKNIIGYY
jgi:hypothetical protein